MRAARYSPYWIGCLLLSALTALAQGRPAAKAAPRHPNVIWIIADDHAPYVCGVYGNAKARTPNIDRLADAGIRFDRAYCNSPICSASRQSFLTGRLPHAVGVTLLRTPLPENEITLAEHLRPLGYKTAAIGKMHFNSNLAHGFRTRIDYPQYRNHLKVHKPKPVPKDIPVLGRWRPFKDHARVWLNAMVHPFGRYDDDMPGTFFARQAAQYVTQNRDNPFFLVISFYEPHSPFRFPVEYRNRFKPADMPLQRPGPGDAWQIPVIFEGLTDDEKRGITAAYYTSTEFMDKNVGLVLDAVADAGIQRNTLICYFGDHGYSLGHHGRFEKHCFYEPAVRSPLLFAWKDRIRPGQATDALVEFVDIVPTVLDLCGLPPMNRLHGQSIKPVIERKTDHARDYVFGEYGHHEEAMIRTDRYKLVYITGRRRRDDGYRTRSPLTSRKIILFDLDTDPDEFHDIADRPDMKQTRRRLLDLLDKHLMATQNAPPTFDPSMTRLERIDTLLRPPEERP